MGKCTKRAHSDGDSELSEPNGSDSAQTLDSSSVAEPDALPADVLEIVAELEAEERAEEQATAPLQVASSESPAALAELPSFGPSVSDGTELPATLPTELPATELPPTPPAELPATDAPGEVAVPLAPSLARWPFVLYFVAWVALAAGAGWLLVQAPSGALYATVLYRDVVIAGVAMTVAGPLFALIVWAVAVLMSPGDAHTGLLSRALFRGALATLAGVAVWWAMLAVVDTLRLGRAL